MKRLNVLIGIISVVTVTIAVIGIRTGQNQAAALRDKVATETKSGGVSRSWAAGMEQKELENEIVKWMGEIHWGCRSPYRIQERLSLLFQEWGSRDVDAALRFLERENIGQLLSDDSIVRPGDALSYSAIIGHAEKQPADAWQRLLNVLNQRKEMLERNGAYLRPWIDELAAESVFRTWYKARPEEALQALKNHDSWFDITHDQLMKGITSRSNECSLLLGSALRAVMSETKDAALREKIFQEFVVSNSDFDEREAGVTLSGVFEHDPQQAWEWVGTDGIDWNDQMKYSKPVSKAYLAILMWSSRDPAAAKDFLNSLGTGDHQPLLFEAYLYGQLQKHPERFVELLDSPAFADYKKLIVRPYVFLEQYMSKRIPWPVTYDGDPQPDYLSRLERLEKALLASTVSDDAKQAVRETSERLRTEYLERKDCAH